MSDLVEEWRAIPGFEGLYEVSDWGRVRSLDREIIQRDRWGGWFVKMCRGKVLAPGRSGQSGYASVHLSDGGKAKTKYVHLLVLAAFVGPRPAGLQGCHNRGIAAGNKLSNLRYDTIAENQRDRVADGTDQLGEKNTQAKLTWPEVHQIRASKLPGKELARQFSVSFSQISHIRNGKRWAHV
jgi:hypothetical protein